MLCVYVHRCVCVYVRVMFSVSSSRSSGIHVLTASKVLALPKKRSMLVQRYLADPYLIDGKKFDLRIYVLVTGVEPLRVYIHKEVGRVCMRC